MTAVHEVAREAADWFETAQRADDSGSFVRLKDGAPEWIGEAVREAHCEFLPDDWRYAYIAESFRLIADAGEDEDLDELADQFADDSDIYTGNLLAWLSSNLRRVGYVDEARDEFGAASFESVTQEITAGQAAERREVFAAIRQAVEEEAARQGSCRYCGADADERLAGYLGDPSVTYCGACGNSPRSENPYPSDNPLSRLDATDDPDERELIRNGVSRSGERPTAILTDHPRITDESVPVGSYVQVRTDLRRAYVVAHRDAVAMQRVGVEYVPLRNLSPDLRAIVDEAFPKGETD